MSTSNSNFRMYYDDFTLQSSSDLEYLDTEVKIIKTEFKAHFFEKKTKITKLILYLSLFLIIMSFLLFF